MFFSIVLALFVAFTQARHFPFGRQNQPVPFIIGGEDVSPIGKWPFMASLWVRVFIKDFQKHLSI